MKAWLSWVLLASAACTAAGAPSATPPPSPAAAGRPEAIGTLRTEQITVELGAGAVQVRVTPLAPELLRLTAPDTRRRLEALAAAQRARLGAATSSDEQTLWLVSFRSTRLESRFSPESLVIEADGQRLRAARILPLTPGWGEQRVHPQGAEAAVYVIDHPISMLRPFLVDYEGVRSDGWRAVIPLLEQELARLASEP